MSAKRQRPPDCPRHPGSSVSFDGAYGAATRRRQRYRCRPADGAPPPRFSEPLPRQGAGRATPRLFTYTTAEIATALVAVGEGMSYRAAAGAMRGRLRGGGPAPDGNSVADWVEIFAPVVFARAATTSWPSAV